MNIVQAKTLTFIHFSAVCRPNTPTVYWPNVADAELAATRTQTICMAAPGRVSLSAPTPYNVLMRCGWASLYGAVVYPGYECLKRALLRWAARRAARASTVSAGTT